MPKFDRFLIAPSNTGWQTDLRPWLLNDDAFAELKNAYVFRGRVRKRFGSRFMIGGGTSQTNQLLSRLRIQLPNTDGSGDAAGTVPGVKFKLGQAFSVGTTIFTVNDDTAGPQAMLSTGTATGTYNVSTGAYTITGADHVTAVWFYPAEPVMGLTNYSPTAAINNQASYAWDTQFSYVFTGGFWQQTPSATTAIWNNPSGDYLNYFWSTNWQGINAFPQIMFTTNFQVTNPDGASTATDDPIWFYDGSNVSFGAPTWTPAIGVNGFYFRPAGGAPYTGPFIQTSRLIVVFKNRLVCLNTIESSGTTSKTLPSTDGSGNASGTSTGGVIGEYFLIGTTYFTIISPTGALRVSTGGTGTGTYNVSTGAYTFAGASATTAIYFFSTTGTYVNYSNRARFCHLGSPFSVNAWYEPNQVDNATPKNKGDGGSYVDAATEEQIISCEFIKDRLIVYFERSTWELAYSGNQIQPFNWQKINTELGSESQFSTVPFDQQIFTIGNTGVHACNGANVQRIDIKIPDQIFKIGDKNVGVQRVVGIRDYFAEMVYWAFPSDNENTNDKYPNQVLVYNYRNGAWALNDDCITMFGYFEQETGLAWSQILWTWAEWNETWDSGTEQPQSRQIIAGNMQGFVFILDTEMSRNERVMQITDLIPASPVAGSVQLVLVDHTLEVGDFVSVENAGGVTVSGQTIYEVLSVVNSNTVIINDPNGTITGTYTGGGNSARVSIIEILSKQWNPYIDKDRNVFIQRIDFGITPTVQGEITVDYYPSGTELSMIQQGSFAGTNAILGNNILETSPYPPSLAPLEQFQELLWHPVYFQSDGTTIQIYMYFDYDQMTTPGIAWSEFEMQGLTLFCAPTTARLQ